MMAGRRTSSGCSSRRWPIPAACLMRRRRWGKAGNRPYALRRAAPNSLFAFAWDAAIKLAHARLVDIALERAIDAEVVPIFHRGEQVGERRPYDNRLLMFLHRKSQRLNYR